MKYTELTAADFTLVTSQGKMLLTLLELEKKNSIEAAIYCESDGSFCCLLPAVNSKIKLPDINGLVIEYQDFKKVGSVTLDRFILIKCTHKSYFDNFIQILKEILGQYDNTDLALSDCLIIVISKWRHFLSAPKVNILDEDEIVGLLGELLFIDLILKEVDCSYIEHWTADRGEEDFIYGDTIIEIKTTKKEKHAHYINGIDQLLVDKNKTKYILSILLTESGNGQPLTLPFLINQIATTLSNYPNLIDLFYDKLRVRKYDIRDSSLYEPFNYFIYRTGLFLVDDDFPKLTSQELSNPLNSRISKISYLLDMEGLSSKEMSSVNFKNLLK
jgi:hypothetical protein